MIEKQKTIKNEVSISGSGLHTGEYGTLTFKPADINSGIIFYRIDIDGKPAIEAIVENVVDTSRGTTIGENNILIYTVEHVLAAVSSFGIDNIIIEINQIETPIMDGSSKHFVEALKKAVVVEQDAEREFIHIDSEIRYYDEKNDIELVAIPHNSYSLEIDIDYGSKILKKQNAYLNCLDEFEKEIAKCRTFVFLHELEYLLNNNLIKGGDLNNAIVFVNRKVSQKELDRLADLFQKPKVKICEGGILNNLDLHFENEPARHKLLDVIGDLTLVGKPIKGKIYARKPGHYSNVEFAKLIKKQYNNNNNKNNKMTKVRQFDLNKAPLYDINQIMKILPHRPPFLLIDKILEMGEDYVVGLKNVSMNENYFVGHFPDEPIMPGVLQIEAMAQTGGILLLSNVPNPDNYLTLFLKINNVRFRQKVVPGDTIIFDLKLISPIRRGICHMKGVASVGENIAMEAEMMAQIVKK